MPQQPMTVNPVYYESEDGSEQLADFQIQHAHQGGQVAHEVYYDDQGNANYYIEEEESFSEETTSDSDDYVNVIAEAYPDLQDALSWATTNLDPDQAAMFNQAVDSGDPDSYMPLLEALIEDYRESNGLDEEEYETEETEDEADDVTEEELGQVFTEMSESEPQGQAFAMPYLQAAIESQGSNPLYSDWCRLTAQFHNGEIEYEQAWEEMTNKYSLPQLKQMYFYINQQ